MAVPSSIADIGRAFDIGSSRAGFATNMPTYPTGYGAPYAPKDPYSTALLSPTDMSQMRFMFDLWGNRIRQSIGSMAGPFNEFSGRFKTFEDYLNEIRDSLKPTPTVITPPAGTAPPPPAGGIVPPTPAGTLPDLRNPLDPAADLIVDTGRIITDLPVRGVGPGDTVVGGGGTNDLLGLPANVTYLGGDSAIEDTGRPWIRTPDGWMADPAWVDPRITDRQADLDLITNLDPIDTPQPGDTAVDATTGLPIIFGADGQWTWANGPAGVGPPPGYMVNPEGEIAPGTGGSVTVVGGPGPDILSEPLPFPAGVPGDMVLLPSPNPQDPWEPIVLDPDLTDLGGTVDPNTVINLADAVSTLVGGPGDDTVITDPQVDLDLITDLDVDPNTVIDDTILGGGVSPVGGSGDDVVVDPVTGLIDTTGLGQTIVTLGQGLDAAGNVINIVQGIQDEDPTRSIAGLIGLIGNPAVLNALDIPNVVPGTGTTVPVETGQVPGSLGGTADQGGVSITGASAVAGGLLVMGSSLASDAPDAEKALQASAGAAQAVGGVAQIMQMEGVPAAMAAVRLALGIVANTFTDKPAEQQAVEAALDTVSAAAMFMGPYGAVVMMAAQVVKIAVTKLWHPDTPHRVREALETSNIGRVVSTAISAIEQAETADELHAVATQGNFGENDWIVAIPMTAGADARETLDLLSGDPTANVQAGVLDQFKDPMNRAVGGMLKRQAGLIRAAESFTAGSPTPGRQYLASDVDYFMRNIERFDGAPYEALDAAQVERVVGQHLMEVFRRQGGGWYGPWLDPNLVYNQQGIDEPLRRRGVSEEDIEAARQLFAAKAPALTEVQYSQDPAQTMAELTGLPSRTTRYFVQGAAGPSSTIAPAAEPLVAQPDGETGAETEEQRANRLYEASIASQQGP